MTVMTPDDLANLLRWLYSDDAGGGWLPASARAFRLNERNLRGMLGGKLPIPDAVESAVLGVTAGLSMLNHWQRKLDQLEALPLTEATRERLHIAKMNL